MSYPGHPPAPAVAPPASRPTTLALAFLGALVTGLAGLVASVLLLVRAHDLAADTVDEIAGDVLGDELTRATVDEAAATLQTRGVAGIVSALLVIGFAFAIRGGAMWARIVLTVLLAGFLCAGGLQVADVAPAATKALDVLAWLLGLATIVLMFLPPSNAYARARRQGAVA
ncbi:hypothetical protein ACQP1P_13540 [Dactylosporangium sp. CA-052675]|uniref:hypothetical protein n=1 Tax=Dactylosporangium sp. CA-052675 TaxID=3239927 RepID=UPI003D92C8E5